MSQPASSVILNVVAGTAKEITVATSIVAAIFMLKFFM